MKIIAFVGADGTGKSTQARMLAERLQAEGKRALCVRPVFLLFDPWRIRGQKPAADSLSPRMRRLSGSAGSGRSHRQASVLGGLVGYLYALATYGYMRAAFRHQEYLVCDRYLYQYFYDLFGPAAVGVAVAFPHPDAIFWLDGGVGLLEARSQLPMTDGERTYYGRVLMYYQELAEHLPFVHLDAGADPQRIGDEVRSRLSSTARRATA